MQFFVTFQKIEGIPQVNLTIDGFRFSNSDRHGFEKSPSR
jgi:hypothetical protein